MISKYLHLILLAVVIVVFALVDTATAQPSDITYTPVQKRGEYDVHVMPAADGGVATALICIKRVDTDPEEVLGCAPATPGVEVGIHISIPITPNDDAEIRAFAYDTEDTALANESGASINAGLLIFTPPGRPELR